MQSQRHEGRLLAIGLVCIPLLLLYMALHYYYILPRLELNRQWNELLNSYGRFYAMQQQEQLITEKMAELQQAQQRDKGDFLSQNTADLAAAALQQRLKDQIRVHAERDQDCQVLSQQTIPDRSVKPAFIAVRLKVNLYCTLTALQPVLYSLETGNPLLTLNNLTLQRERQQPESKPTRLKVSFEIIGYLRPQPDNNNTNTENTGNAAS